MHDEAFSQTNAKYFKALIVPGSLPYRANANELTNKKGNQCSKEVTRTQRHAATRVAHGNCISHLLCE